MIRAETAVRVILAICALVMGGILTLAWIDAGVPTSPTAWADCILAHMVLALCVVAAFVRWD